MEVGAGCVGGNHRSERLDLSLRPNGAFLSLQALFFFPASGRESAQSSPDVTP